MDTAIRSKFRKSHTCGSLFANCHCSTTTSSLATELQNQSNFNEYQITSNKTKQKISDSDTKLCSRKEKKTRKLYQSYSHPDTKFIFTDKNKNPIPKDSFINDDSTITTKSGNVAIKCSKRSSSPNVGNYAILDLAIHPEIVVKVSRDRPNREERGYERNSLSFDSQRFILQRSSRIYNNSESDGSNDRQTNSMENICNNEQDTTNDILDANGTPVLNPSSEYICNSEAAKKFFEESGILGQISNSSSSNSNQISKTMQNKSNICKEQFRKNSKNTKNIRNVLSSNDDEKFDIGQQENCIKSFKEEVEYLKEIVKTREGEISKLKREIHKLKSVLQQTAANNLNFKEQNCYENNEFKNCKTVEQIENNKKMTREKHTGTIANKQKSKHAKKQGVSGESIDSTSQKCQNVKIPKYEKDIRSKQLIKDSIMDNDFLKHLDSTQIRELVESMYSLDIPKGDFVIREGDVGAHLYVSAKGEFEVMKSKQNLGTMGPGKTFGELAILYNCTRTASVSALTDSVVWVLDRRVFQQIMMRTGLQRIQENVQFLKSVPLLKNLSNDVVTKIADVLEVEFYPAGTYIIRQGAKGDTFFLISQGTVQVTQRHPNTGDEKEIRTLTRGDYFGEQALINEDNRTANIIAMEPGVECLTLDRESFTNFIGDLSELKEKNYDDKTRNMGLKPCSNENKESFDSDVIQELQDLKLSDLKILSTLGIGGFGRVELVKCQRNNRTETYALKCLKKKHIVDTRQEDHVFSERTIMLACKTPFICRLYRTFKDSKFVYMLLEACLGGEIWTMLRDRGNFDETSTQFIIACVLQAFEYLHNRGIIYRDLKPENLMLDVRGYVKLVDFGFAKYIGYSNKTWTFCGTPEYVAPEIILNKGHDRAVDYWALGILMHELISGAPPFTANEPMKIYNIILKGIDMVNFPKHMSRSAITLIKKLCRDVPAERLGYHKGGIQDIKKHKWFQGFDWDGLKNQGLIPPFFRPILNPVDTSYFDNFPAELESPPDEMSGWDADF